MSHKLYADAAARQRAFRERRRMAPADAPAPATAAPRREPSQKARLTGHSEGLRNLAAEYQNWRDRLPRNLAEGETAARLDEVIAELDDIAERIESLEPPVVGA